MWVDPEWAAAVTVSAETREEDGVLFLEVDVLNCEALTGPQARRLATAIGDAVEVYERLTG